MAVPCSRAKFVATRWTNRVCFAGTHRSHIPAENPAVARTVQGLHVVCFSDHNNHDHDYIATKYE